MSMKLFCFWSGHPLFHTTLITFICVFLLYIQSSVAYRLVVELLQVTAELLETFTGSLLLLCGVYVSLLICLYVCALSWTKMLTCCLHFIVGFISVSTIVLSYYPAIVRNHSTWKTPYHQWLAAERHLIATWKINKIRMCILINIMSISIHVYIYTYVLLS